MNERLPRITADIDVDVDTFLKRVERVADDMGKFYIDRPKFPIPKDTKAIDLWLYDSSKQKNVKVRFYHPSWEPNQIRDFPDRYQKLFGSRLIFDIQAKNA